MKILFVLFLFFSIIGFENICCMYGATDSSYSDLFPIIIEDKLDQNPTRKELTQFLIDILKNDSSVKKRILQIREILKVTRYGDDEINAILGALCIYFELELKDLEEINSELGTFLGFLKKLF